MFGENEQVDHLKWYIQRYYGGVYTKKRQVFVAELTCAHLNDCSADDDDDEIVTRPIECPLKYNIPIMAVQQIV